MSAIAGVFGPGSSPETVKIMLSHMKHRGPHGTQIAQGDRYAVGAACLELSPERTPALAENNGCAIVLDGLLCRTRNGHASDVEALAAHAASRTVSWLSRLDGAFALAVADADTLLLARDAVGPHPLLYGHDGDTVYFASEIKALRGLVSQVEELPPGHAFRSTEKTVEPYPVYEPDLTVPGAPEAAARQLRDLLREAVRVRMEGTRVEGVALSGGLDSSIIAALAWEFNPDLHLFTVGLEGSPDVRFARIMAEHLGASDRHHVYTMTEEEIEAAVPDAVRFLESFDEDCISGVLANYFAARLASRYTRATLCGEGADELFGGYHLLKKLPLDERQAMMDRLVAIAYNTALRRLDRGWMSHSVLHLTPFLDARVVAAARAIPPEWKIYGEREIEKYILREAFRDLLPPEIADREKLRFAAGSSVDDIMDRIAERHVSKTEFEQNRVTAGNYCLNSPKEYWYYQIYRHHFPDPGFEGQVARWDPFK